MIKLLLSYCIPDSSLVVERMGNHHLVSFEIMMNELEVGSFYSSLSHL